MKKTAKQLFIVLLLIVGSTACEFGQHNQAQVPGVNQDSERIYGPSREAEPMQLNNEYPADESGEVAGRIQDIRQKMFSE